MIVLDERKLSCTAGSRSVLTRIIRYNSSYLNGPEASCELCHATMSGHFVKLRVALCRHDRAQSGPTNLTTRFYSENSPSSKSNMADEEQETHILMRPLQQNDLPFLIALEQSSFPPNEAATPEKVESLRK
jgi:hypothetical protein